MKYLYMTFATIVLVRYRMVTLQKFPVVLLFLIQVTNFFRQAEANVISECINYTTCSETYGDVYNSLASQRNYYNIALALYPSRKPSAVLVHVNLYAFNQTEKSSPVQYTPVQYTWSMSCLYVSFPPKVLEVLSLGSILVTSRTRGLNIAIPPFCCNVSKDERIVIIDRVLSELQDLAVSPGLQDPTRNTAECVIQGHKPNISATGRSTYIKAMLWSSFSFSFFFGPLLALITFIFFEEARKDNTGKKENRQNLEKALKYTTFFLMVVELGLQLAVIVLSTIGNSKAPTDIFVILGLISFEGLVMVLVVRMKWFDFLPRNNRSGVCEKLCIFLWGNLTAFHFCWLAVGIMVNPIWGFTVLLVICVVIGAIVFSGYILIDSSSKGFKLRFAILCFTALLAVFSLVALVILAGQSFFGRETASELVKTALLYVTTAFISWIVRAVNKEEKGGKLSKPKKYKGKNEDIPMVENENS